MPIDPQPDPFDDGGGDDEGTGLADPFVGFAGTDTADDHDHADEPTDGPVPEPGG